MSQSLLAMLVALAMGTNFRATILYYTIENEDKRAWWRQWRLIVVSGRLIAIGRLIATLLLI
jgi:hypothetical protein